MRIPLGGLGVAAKQPAQDLGMATTAEIVAATVRALAEQGLLPGVESSKAPRITLAMACELYASEHKPRAKSGTRRKIDLHTRQILGALGGETPLSHLDARGIAEGLRSLGLGPAALGTAQEALRAVLRRAQREGWLSSDPMAEIPRYRSRRRTEHLSLRDLSTLTHALDEAQEYRPALDVIRLLVLTGARVSEVAGLTWRECDLGAGILRLEDSKTGPRDIILSKRAITILDRQWGNHKHWVFPGERGCGAISARQIGKVFGRVRDAAGLRKTITPHTLRHTWITTAKRQGVDLDTIRRAAGHSNLAMTQTYMHGDLADLRHAAESVANAVARAED